MLFIFIIYINRLLDNNDDGVILIKYTQYHWITLLSHAMTGIGGIFYLINYIYTGYNH